MIPILRTHNICFCGEIRKISGLSVETKKCFIWSNEIIMVKPIFRSYTVIKDILNYHNNYQCSYNLNHLWKIMHNLLPNIYAHYLHSRSPKLRCQMLWLIFFFTFVSHLTLVLLNLDIPCLGNSVDPDQLASKKPTDLDLHCLQLSM